MRIQDAAKKMARSDRKVLVRRVMWSDFDARVELEFDEHAKNTEAAARLGNIYIWRGEPEKYAPWAGLLSYQYVRSVNIGTGNRRLGYKLLTENGFEDAVENRSQLWYTQMPSGAVKVFMAPYSSNVGIIKENELIIGSYKDPASITRCEIAKHFGMFFKYCTLTSQSNIGFASFAYRTYLMYKDFRYRPKMNAFVVGVLERSAALLLAAAAIIATLHVGGKIEL